MAEYRITYQISDAPATYKTIDLLCGNDGVRVEWKTEINRNVSSTGIYENVVQNTLKFVSFDCYFREAEFHKLETFMSFAQQGRPFSFTKDSTKAAVQTTLSADALVGANTISVTDDMQSYISDGDYIIISDTFGTKWDVVPATTVGTTTISLGDTLSNAYTAADSAVGWYYAYPALYLLDDTFDPNRDGAFWHHAFDCVEVRNVA